MVELEAIGTELEIIIRPQFELERIQITQDELKAIVGKLKVDLEAIRRLQYELDVIGRLQDEPEAIRRTQVDLKVIGRLKHDPEAISRLKDDLEAIGRRQDELEAIGCRQYKM